MQLPWVNPLSYGEKFSLSMLNWHLWFVPIFLIVTACMPFLAKIKHLKRPRFLCIVIGFAGLVLALDTLNFHTHALLKSVIFYSFFCLLGYHFSKTKQYFLSQKMHHVLMVLTVLLLGAVALNLHGDSLNMQVNKFPPNHVFFLFSCCWLLAFYFVTIKVPGLTEKINQGWRAHLLKPFISSGYSIYLWQGLGYTLAVRAGVHWHLPLVMVWFLALFLSIGLGLLASPLEKLRIR